jgi:isoamylase
MTTEDWTDGQRRSFGMQFGNESADGPRLLLFFNAAPEPVPFRLPGGPIADHWVPVLESAIPTGLVRDRQVLLAAGGTFRLQPRSVVLLQHTSSAELP